MPHLIEQLHVNGTHFQVGYAIGQHFAQKIHHAFDHYPFFQEKLLPYHHTAAGQARFKTYLELTKTRYPAYIAELEGLAQGAERPFAEIMLINLRGEYREFFHHLNMPGCSDCALLTDEVALIGHNEDGDPEFRENMYLVHAQINDKPAFTALSYPGFLCGNALGFNSNGICFSVDNVRPLATSPGVGRHFVARSLLEATSLDDAVQRATIPQRASGFYYTLGSTTERRIIAIETAPTTHTAQELQGCYFHANHYQELDIQQMIEPSSANRVESCATHWQSQPPTTATDVLSMLSDQSNPAFPIRRSAAGDDDLATFCTTLFNLDTQHLHLYFNHPLHNPTQSIQLSMSS